MNVKRLFSIPLLLLYVLSSTGIPLEAHFCGSKLSDLSLFSAEHTDDCCSAPAKRRKMNCCSNTQLKVTIEDTHVNSSTLQLKWPKFTTSLQNLFYRSNKTLQVYCVKNSEVNSWVNPPPLSGNKLYLSIGVFLI
jgi:hypothetical protein